MMHGQFCMTKTHPTQVPVAPSLRICSRCVQQGLLFPLWGCQHAQGKQCRWLGSPPSAGAESGLPVVPGQKLDPVLRAPLVCLTAVPRVGLRTARCLPPGS